MCIVGVLDKATLYIVSLAKIFLRVTSMYVLWLIDGRCWSSSGCSVLEPLRPLRYALRLPIVDITVHTTGTAVSEMSGRHHTRVSRPYVVDDCLSQAGLWNGSRAEIWTQNWTFTDKLYVSKVGVHCVTKSIGLIRDGWTMCVERCGHIHGWTWRAYRHSHNLRRSCDWADHGRRGDKGWTGVSKSHRIPRMEGRWNMRLCRGNPTYNGKRLWHSCSRKWWGSAAIGGTFIATFGWTQGAPHLVAVQWQWVQHRGSIGIHVVRAAVGIISNRWRGELLDVPWTRGAVVAVWSVGWTGQKWWMLELLLGVNVSRAVAPSMGEGRLVLWRRLVVVEANSLGHGCCWWSREGVLMKVRMHTLNKDQHDTLQSVTYMYVVCYP